MDAMKISDDPSSEPMVMLKRVWGQLETKEPQKGEAYFNTLFRSQDMACDPMNHCSSYINLLPVPGYEDLSLMVMPFLRPYNNPKFRTVRECLDFFQQLFEV